jgi:hypothetical protein
MAADLDSLRLTVFRTFAATGTAPDVDALSAELGLPAGDVRDGLRELQRQRHLALDDADRIVMAHPFASIPLGFSVMGRTTLWWGGCAWDSFALPHVLTEEPDVLVATRCPACGQPHAWVVGRDEPPAGEQVAHFLVPVSDMWDDVVHTCRHQRLFCSLECVDMWLDETGHPQGYVLDLATLWKLASHWYDGRLEPSYRRRNPTEARAYFQDVGLTGPFWGLDAIAG